MKRISQAFCAVFAIAGCGSTAVTPGTPQAVARAAANAYSAAGHTCKLKADLAYCDTNGRDLPLLIGYHPQSQELLFATVYDTEAGFGKPCSVLPANQVMRPEWMTVKCDEIEYDNKQKKIVLSVVGGGRIPDQGMSRAELNRSAGLFIQEAEGYLIRLKVQATAPSPMPQQPERAIDTSTTKL